MYDVLTQLNKTSGVTGSMVVGNDGIVIAADLNSQTDDETVGALASSIAASVQKSLNEMNSGEFAQITVEAEGRKMFLSNAGIGTLVVTTEPRVNIGLVRLEIRNAITELQKI
jgi:predicted regulator of Ras-like GTPase activity (Roadblock/LC7/MglB family)